MFLNSCMYAIPTFSVFPNIYIVTISKSALRRIFFLIKKFFFVHILRVMTCFIFRNVYVVFEVLIAISKNISLVTVKVNCAAFHERVIFNFILCLKRL